MVRMTLLFKWKGITSVCQRFELLSLGIISDAYNWNLLIICMINEAVNDEEKVVLWSS